MSSATGLLAPSSRIQLADGGGVGFHDGETAQHTAHSVFAISNPLLGWKSTKGSVEKNGEPLAPQRKDMC